MSLFTANFQSDMADLISVWNALELAPAGRSFTFTVTYCAAHKRGSSSYLSVWLGQVAPTTWLSAVMEASIYATYYRGQGGDPSLSCDALAHPGGIGLSRSAC